ncbi:MAG: hypothetical protein JWQ66_2089 [Mucilaginibacter sp.]|nr:hypothetical protein [Mucilaginibacter sp.]
MKPFLALCICFFLFSGLVWGQPGISEMQDARQDLTATFFSAFDLSLVLAAIFGILGALRIYHNAQMGRERITAEVAAWFFAALFMTVAGVFLRALFGI